MERPEELFPPLPDRLPGESENSILWASALGGRDALTGCWIVEALGAHVEAFDAAVALVHVDLPGFTDVNAALGHSAANAILADIAHRLARRLPHEPAAFLGRTSGDEFTVVLQDPERAPDIIELVDITLAEPRLVQPQFRGRDQRRRFDVWFPPGRVKPRTIEPFAEALDAALAELRAADQPRIRPVIARRD